MSLEVICLLPATIRECIVRWLKSHATNLDLVGLPITVVDSRPTNGERPEMMAVVGASTPLTLAAPSLLLYRIDELEKPHVSLPVSPSLRMSSFCQLQVPWLWGLTAKEGAEILRRAAVRDASMPPYELSGSLI